MDKDELLYGDYTVQPETHVELDERAEPVRAARELARIRHVGVNHLGNKVVFWTRSCAPKIGFLDAYEEELLHRDGAPAVLHYDNFDKRVVVRTWYRDGVRHREDGPALSLSMGVARESEYWWNGLQLEEDDWRYAVKHGELPPAD